MGDERGSGRVSGAADDVWAWLAACRTCGEEHHLRADTCECGRQCRCAPSGYQTWAHPVDGHTYYPRLGTSDMARLRAEWQQQEVSA